MARKIAVANEDLTKEIIEQIQTRLSVKSLMRFTCISKWWSSIIADPKFAKSHYELALQKQTLSRKVLFWDQVNCQFESLDSNTSSSRKLAFSFKQPGEEYAVDKLGSCNGLVFLCAVVNDVTCKELEFYVWNPSTGYVRNLPAPSFSCFLADIRNCVIGYVSAANDYKVVIGAFVGGERIIEMFSWRANSWKRIEAFSFEYRFDDESTETTDDGYSYKGTVLNEALHWIETLSKPGTEEAHVVDEPSRDDAVLVFDWVNDEFRKLPLPIINNNEEFFRNPGVVCGGCLSVASFGSNTIRSAMGHERIQCARLLD